MGRHKPYTTIDRFIGMRIRERRAVLGMTQRELAEPLGLASFVISTYEAGSHSIGASRLYEIARLLRISPEYFFEGFEDHYTPKPPARQRLSLGFVRSISQIDNKADLEAVAHVVRVMAGKTVRDGSKAVRRASPLIVRGRRAARCPRPG